MLGKARAARRARQAFARRRHAPTTTATGAASRAHHAAIHRRATRSDVDRTHLDHAVAHPAGRRVVALPAQVATPGRASRNSVRPVADVRSYGVPVAVAPRRCAGPCRCHALPCPRWHNRVVPELVTKNKAGEKSTSPCQALSAPYIYKKNPCQFVTSPCQESYPTWCTGTTVSLFALKWPFLSSSDATLTAARKASRFSGIARIALGVVA